MKESLQEATQRAILESYKNLNENKSLKKEGKISNKRMTDLIYEMFYWLDEVLDEDDIDRALKAIGVSKAQFEGDKDIPNDKLSDVLNNAIDYVSEHVSPSDEKDTFKNSIGFTDEEMKKLGMEFEDDELEESKKVETAQHLYVVQGNYGDGWEDVYSSEDRDDAKARLKEYEENESEYPHRFITKRPNTSIRDMYRDLHNDIVANKAKWGESKKVEGKSNVVSALKEINVSSFQELRDEIEDMLEKEIINEEYEDFLDIISEQEEACEDYINRRSNVTNTDWKDELSIESDYVTSAIQDLISSVSKIESKKVEDFDYDKINDYYKTATTDLEKAFTTEVKYWLQTLIDEKSNDEIGKKATSVIKDNAKVKEIVDELVNGSDDLWETIHTKIEHLAGIDYRHYSNK